jgi:hypothetical protein
MDPGDHPKIFVLRFFNLSGTHSQKAQRAFSATRRRRVEGFPSFRDSRQIFPDPADLTPRRTYLVPVPSLTDLRNHGSARQTGDNARAGRRSCTHSRRAYYNTEAWAVAGRARGRCRRQTLEQVLSNPRLDVALIPDPDPVAALFDLL